MLRGIGIGRAEPVLVGVLVAVGLDEGDQRRVERRRVLPDLLEHDLAALKDGGRWCVAQAVRRAIDVQDVGAGVGLALLEHDPVALDPSHAAEPDHVLDLPQGIDLAGTEHRDAVHRRVRRRVDADQAPRCFQAIEQVLDVRRLRTRLGVERDAVHVVANELQRLEVAPVVKPMVPRADPADPIWRHVIVQKPGAGVDRRLAGPEHGVTGARPCGGR